MIVSIVICTRDRAASLGGTLASLAAIRSEHEWEVILLDNGSADETAAVILAADDCGGRLRYAYEGRPGLGAARDAAWRLTTGEIVAFTDDDCYLDPGFVDAFVQAFAEHPDAGCIGGRILLHDAEDAAVTIDVRTEPARIRPHSFVHAGALQGANLAVRRAVLAEVGGVDVELGAGTPFPCEDIDLVAATIWAGHPAYFDPRPVVHHHHRRRAADLPKLFAGYDRGRGAYFAKYMLRRDTRMATMRAWFGRARTHPAATRQTVERETRSALAYLRAHDRAAAIRFLPFSLMLRAASLLPR